MVVFYALFLGVLLVVQVAVAVKFSDIACEKGHGKESHSFAMCFWLGIIGYLYVIALPDRTIVQYRVPKEELKKQSYICPYCKKPIPYDVESCPICKKNIDWNL